MTMVVDEQVDEFGKPKLVVTSPKFTSKFVIYKSNNGFSFYKIKISQGHTPRALSSSFTGIDLALNALKNYINSAKESKTVRTRKPYEESK